MSSTLAVYEPPVATIHYVRGSETIYTLVDDSFQYRKGEKPADIDFCINELVKENYPAIEKFLRDA
jgi:hypothetical protein